MQAGEFGWTLARWNLVILVAAAIVTFAVVGSDVAVAAIW